MKIYTKTGDAGETSLIGGGRVKKSCLEIEAIGEVDELNALVGILIASLQEKIFVEAQEKLTQVQHRLFTIGSNLADVQLQLGHVPKLRVADVTDLEAWIDGMERDLKPLKQFILPRLPGRHIFCAGRLPTGRRGRLMWEEICWP